MDITIDFTPILQIGSRGPLYIMGILFIYGGWIIPLVLIVRLWWVMRLNRLQAKFAAGIEYILLAIDVPKNSEQTPKAMEQVFATLSGAHNQVSGKEKYLQGAFQIAFSFEIISIDGYVQFLVRCARFQRDLVEGAIYAHYPDAEITEVLDYTKDIPTRFPNDEFNMWGAEIELAGPDPLPIKTYMNFHDMISGELKDPLAGLLETMSRIQRGEQVWIQIIAQPTDNSWVASSLKMANKIAGRKPPKSKSTFIQPLMDWLYRLPDWIPMFAGMSSEAGKEDKDDPSKIMYLTPSERGKLEAIEYKASKIGFVCKLRLIYLAPHEKFQSKRVVSSVFGGIKQFGDHHLNAFKPNKRTKTQVVWFNVQNRVNQRRTRLMANYKSRSWYAGSRFFILNTEELASLYHFPALQVQTPFLKRTEVKKSQAPIDVPTEAEEPGRISETQLRQELVNLQLDNTYYEDRYAVERGMKPSPEREAQQQKQLAAELQQPAPDEITEDSENLTPPDNLPLV